MDQNNNGLEYYDRVKEVKQFDETKAGVKGLVESGVTKVPRFLIHTPSSADQSPLNVDNDHDDDHDDESFKVPVIDLGGLDDRSRRGEIVREIREASGTWGFFKMVNHGVPEGVMSDMLEGVRRFHEQPKEARTEWYSRDPQRRVRYYCNGNLLDSNTAGWRDSIAFDFQLGPINPQTFPSVCREEVEEYMKHMVVLRETLSELMSEALGLRKEHLGSIECMKSEVLVCHYYPVCPQPKLTQGTTTHADPSALTILLQDHTGGLQVLFRGRWVHVTPSPAVLIANVGDFMQLITNDKFKSVQHRVLSGGSGPRVSAACFLYPSHKHRYTPYGPIRFRDEDEEEDEPLKYRDTNIVDYLSYYRSKLCIDGNSALPHFKL